MAKKQKKKRKYKYTVSIEYTTVDEVEVKATNKKKALEKAYNELYIDGKVTNEQVRRS